MAQLVEWLLPKAEIPGLSPVFGKFYLIPTVLTRPNKEKKRPGMGLFLENKLWIEKQTKEGAAAIFTLIETLNRKTGKNVLAKHGKGTNAIFASTDCSVKEIHQNYYKI